MSPPDRRSPFAPLVVLGMVAVGVFAFAAFTVLSAYAPDLRSGSDGGAHALSRSAVGFAGLTELLRAEGRAVVVSRGPHPGGAAEHGLLVLTPGPDTDAKALARLSSTGPRLVVLPKWVVAPDPKRPGWVLRAALLGPQMAPRALPAEFGTTLGVDRRAKPARLRLHAVAGPFAEGEGFSTGQIVAFQTVQGPGWVPVLVDETGAAVLVRSAKAPVYVLADPDLLNTHGLADLDTARTASEVIEGLRAGDGPVVFDVTLNGYKRGRSVLRLAFEPPFLAVTLCAVAVALLAGLQAIARFGPAGGGRRAFALGKQALADNTAGLIRMADREPRMADRYAALSRNAAARAVGAPRDMDEAELDALLDRLGRARGTEHALTDLLAEAKRVESRAELMRVARKLHQWRLEMTRDRR